MRTYLGTWTNSRKVNGLREGARNSNRTYSKYNTFGAMTIFPSQNLQRDISTLNEVSTQQTVCCGIASLWRSNSKWTDCMSTHITITSPKKLWQLVTQNIIKCEILSSHVCWGQEKLLDGRRQDISWYCNERGKLRDRERYSNCWVTDQDRGQNKMAGLFKS